MPEINQGLRVETIGCGAYEEVGPSAKCCRISNGYVGCNGDANQCTLHLDKLTTNIRMYKDGLRTGRHGFENVSVKARRVIRAKFGSISQ